MKTGCSVAKKLWFPYAYDGRTLFGRTLRFPPPRLVQLVKLLHCRLTGHQWGDWLTDDYDGPMVTDTQGGWYPACSRVAQDDEWGMRSCRRRCGTIERRTDARS